MNDRLDVFPLIWSDDGLCAGFPEEFRAPVYRIAKSFGRFRAIRTLPERGNQCEKSRRWKSIQECRDFIRQDAHAAFMKISSHQDPDFWLPMWAAPRSGWGILVSLRPDLAKICFDPAYDSWAGQQVIVCHAEGADPEEDLWDMAGPSGVAGFPGGWFLGWRPLAVPLPPLASRIEVDPFTYHDPSSHALEPSEATAALLTRASDTSTDAVAMLRPEAA